MAENSLGSSDHNIIVAIPSYNEEVAIGCVILGSQRHADDVLVVDDGRGDRTANIARRAGARVIEHEENWGKGAAIKTIISHVRESGRKYDTLVLIAGDSQHTPNDIPELVEPIIENKCDIAIGSRYISQQRTETPLYRRFGQKVLV